MAVGASEAARWQAYQTGARKWAHLWFQIITVVVMAWIALAMSVIWYETGTYYPDLRHAYFWRWVICGIMTDTAYSTCSRHGSKCQPGLAGIHSLS